MNSTRLILPGLAGLYERLAPWSYTLIRFATGAILVPHGVQKVFFATVDRYATNIANRGLPFSDGLAVLTFFAESVAAACVALGLLTRPAAVMVAVQMYVITFVFQWSNGYNWTERGFEYPLLLAVLYTAVAIRGGGPHSIDRLIGREF
jgi:putative oxidoreductase